MKTLITSLLLLASLSLSAQEKDPAKRHIESYDKGEFRIKLALPYFNHITIQPLNGLRVEKYGYVGESLGLEYSNSDKSFIELNAAFANTSHFPIPNHYDLPGPYEFLVTFYMSSTYNHVVSRFTLGYGLNYSVNVLNQGSQSRGDTTIVDFAIINKNRAIGITLNSFYRLGNYINVGVIYKPSILRLGAGRKLNYDHLLSIAFNWRFRLNNK